MCLVRDNYREIVAQASKFGTLYGAEHLADFAEQEAAMLAELLPDDAPDDLYLVTSPPILREVQAKLVDRFDHDVREAFHKRVAIATFAAVAVPDFDPNTIDRLTQDRSDDMVVHTAFEGRAEFVVTADSDLLPDGDPTEYTLLDGRSTLAYSLSGFASLIETSNFSLDQVPEVLSIRVADRRDLSEQYE